ncbi:uncharacterized protein LOC134194033 [Corticium candelabrum]|uniref:uncharacterized protein LOC134194033 n=1 Tax=Corticium candelabrum TaxID=121492 RepID=UPI002E26070E|nr:uncharacterized protein LOC134194033 [Corticium candelabrum]
MSEVRCVSRQGTEYYKLVSLESNFSRISRFWLMASLNSSIIAYDNSEKTLWKFENDVWTNVSTLPDNLQPFRDVEESKIFSCAVATNSASYIVFSLRDSRVLQFDLKRNEFIIENVAGDIPNVWYDQIVSSIFEDENIIIVFTINLRTSRTRIWKFIHENKVWFWKRLPNPDLAPSLTPEAAYDMQSNHLTFWGQFPETPDQRSWNKIIWNLDLASMQWFFKVKNQLWNDYCYEASSWIGSCFVALANDWYSQSIKTMIHNTTDNKWRLISNSSITVRYYTSFVAVNDTTAILFGGTNHITFSNETWIMHLKPLFMWRQAAGDMVHSVRPSARVGHAAAIMQSKMYVFGGGDVSSQCLNDLWMFDVKTERWSKLTALNIGPNFSKACTCLYSAVSTPGQLLITVMMEIHPNASNYRPLLETWMYLVDANTWQFVTSWHPTFYFLPNVKSFKSFYWKGFLVVFDFLQMNIKYLAVRCPAGFTSPNISEIPCNFCRKGYYRETEFDDPDCIPCPNGLTTAIIGARKIEECTVCNVDQCKYGNCVADFSKEGLRPACQCYVGFTGSTCQYPTYFLIGAGIILFVAVATAGVTAYLSVLNRKRKSERAWREEVTVLTNVWQIDEDEVTSGELLGSGASGSVYKGSYRNITVAVKKMVAVGLPKSIEDFETEIMFMRTVRHKNIVLFIGAGKSQPEDVPFLVMEYMERGSLRNVLYDLSIDIDYNRKLSFAMDSARGMHTLHTLEPPRIHRDLKSDNLLVSKDWIVKVADFGLGRDVSSIVTRNGQYSGRRCPSDQEHISLLPKRDGLSYTGVGTERWRAPELRLREPYDTSVDLYSFGIVFWEIWTRELPFNQYRFDHQVSEAVARNERPVIPEDCPQPLAMIMKSCWSSKPSDRLSFDKVILQLEYLDNI